LSGGRWGQARFFGLQRERAGEKGLRRQEVGAMNARG